MVGAFLAALLLTVLVKVAALTYRVGHEEIARSTLEGQGILAASKLEKDLLGTSPAGVTLSDSLDGIVIHPIDTVTTSGQKLFEPYLVLWRQGTTTVNGNSGPWLIRSEITSHPALAASDGQEPVRLSPAEMAALTVGQGRMTQAYAGVTRFTAQPPAGLTAPAMGATVAFTIEMELGLASTRKQIQVQRTLALRSPGM
jgi:hypothetical protein